MHPFEILEKTSSPFFEIRKKYATIKPPAPQPMLIKMISYLPTNQYLRIIRDLVSYFNLPDSIL